MSSKCVYLTLHILRRRYTLNKPYRVSITSFVTLNVIEILACSMTYQRVKICTELSQGPLKIWTDHFLQFHFMKLQLRGAVFCKD
jgi:hypothetical protein